MTESMTYLGRLPEHPEARLWRRLSESRRAYVLGEATLIASDVEIISILRSGGANKQIIRERSAKKMSGGALATLASMIPTSLDGAHHSVIRGSLDGFWKHGGRTRFEARCERAVRAAAQHVDADFDSLPRMIVRAVLSSLVGVPRTAPTIRALENFAPLLNNLVLNADSPTTPDTETACALALDSVLALKWARPGSLWSYLQGCAGISRTEAAGLLTFVCVAASETLFTATQMCMAAQHVQRPVNAVEVLRWATPSPYMLYGATTDLKVGEDMVKEGSLLSFALGSAAHSAHKPSLTFGFGPHFCFGGRLSVRILETLLSLDLPAAPEVRWGRETFVRQLVASNLNYM